MTLEITPANSSLSIGIISPDDIPNIGSFDFGNKHFLFTQNNATIGYSLDNLMGVNEIKNGGF